MQTGFHVHKFGGSSLSDVARFVEINKLLKGQNEFIVVSAFHGVTNALQELLDSAKEGQNYLEKLNALENLHQNFLEKITCKHSVLLEQSNINFKQDFASIRTILESIKLSQSYSWEMSDYVLGYGEMWSARLLSAYLSKFRNVLYLDASEVLFVNKKQDLITLDWNRSKVALDNCLAEKKFDQIIATGFIASTNIGRRTNLGRNGSDYSASIFAKLLKAEKLTIWTDVDGIYSADPNRVKKAMVLKSLSYKEALELAFFGAKVLHPKTLGPMQDKNIPIYIKNSFRPNAAGTCITHQSTTTHLITGMTTIDDIALINIEGCGLTGVAGIAAKIFNLLYQENISVILIAQASSEHSICIAVNGKVAEQAIKTLKENLNYEISQKLIENILIDTDCSIVAVVGDRMINTPGISGRLCAALAKSNINIRAISQGSSERNISIVIKKTDTDLALECLHTAFYLSHKTISIGIIGPGKVGSTLLKQIQYTQAKLQAQYQVDLCVRGIINSQQMLLEHEAIDLTSWKEIFAKKAQPADLDKFASHLLKNHFSHSVIIDCTADENVAYSYIKFIEKGIHIVTPNKHANAAPLKFYKQLKQIIKQRNQHYFYEATVCAGLPVISTLQDMIKTGDEIIKIEGVVSGTLSYIFNELDQGKLFSDIVYQAKKFGLTEPDPRQDLCGMDVARKLVCLARELDYEISLTDIVIHNLIPPSLKNATLEDFLKNLPAYDEQMAKLVKQAQQENKKLCYVGVINQPGNVEIKLKAYPLSHPFAGLKNSDNMLVFYTKRYYQQPLVIQGPGAGAEVTSAGIFSDLLRLIACLA